MDRAPASLPRGEAAAPVSVVALSGIGKCFRGGVRALSDVSLEIEEGAFFSLLGPSGCGKTTLLRLIAGLEPPDAGWVRIGERIVAGPAWVRPEARGVGFVFQDHALFPHMNVEENIAFGLGGLSRRQRAARVAEMLDLTGIGAARGRFPHELSGGQQQRVALARALAPAPRVMLMDEPFSSLDADLRRDIAEETRAILKRARTTALLVTHDREEALALSDRVGILRDGRLEQVGTPYEVYHRPATRFSAHFLGPADFLAGRVVDGALHTGVGVFPWNGRAVGAGLGEGAAADLMVRPDDVAFSQDPNGEAVVAAVRFLGAEAAYALRLPGGDMLHAVQASTVTHAVGTRVRVLVRPAHVVSFPR